MGKALALIGIVLTLLYGVFSWWLIGDRVQTLQSMSLNEVGDFLAGAFGPVAILWLVLGFFQQGIELRQGTAALNLQGEELKNSVAQQIEMVAMQKASLENYERSLEPLLQLQASRGGWDREEFCVDLVVSNSGEYCELIVVALFGLNGTVRRSKLDPLVRGASHFAYFRGLHEWENFEIVIEYKTRSGASNRQSFSVFDAQEEGYGHSYEVRKHAFLT